MKDLLPNNTTILLKKVALSETDRLMKEIDKIEIE